MSEGFKEGPDIQGTQFRGPSLSQQRRVIHFSSGETLEEDNSETEEDTSHEQVFREPEDMLKLPWRAYTWSLGRKSLRTCDFLGGKLAGLLGLNTAKYQYAVDEYQRSIKTKPSKETECSYEEGTEIIHLSSRMSSEYGATSSHRLPAGSQASQNIEHRTTGSHNKGYQNDNEH
ncbi:protein FAM177A1-like isoform X1 [Salmo salar]|uniref:Protein FAM177A1-like n=1 Tax=Salmo salar TaxID=8030 RepID=A0A1S3MAS6_SALSA|nr:protein FAM177A1-like isoform X1 [Salmo salar]XP_045551716.1 protein FAM177A1-like isoform X1 [Salmo salar]XP_045551717.1 protein FAM177A1-like isoform X1 [Salmo salar]|eukprot:XP_014000081.1 PREDICTED: protein FAM177A1-like [Salmo salar]